MQQTLLLVQIQEEVEQSLQKLVDEAVSAFSVSPMEDPDYKPEDGQINEDAELVVVENTSEVHNMVVCTLCSCYPRTILGMPPDWYKSKTYRSRSVNEPRAVLKEFGTDLADDVAVRVHDSNADMRYLVLPVRPEGTDGWSEPELAKLVSRDSMIGVSPARQP